MPSPPDPLSLAKEGEINGKSHIASPLPRSGSAQPMFAPRSGGVGGEGVLHASNVALLMPAGVEVVPFTAETRMSGLRMNGTALMKGAVDSIVAASQQVAPPDLQTQSERIAREGGTPLAVSENGQILGLVYLKDTVKPGMVERFDEPRGWAFGRSW